MHRASCVPCCADTGGGSGGTGTLREEKSVFDFYNALYRRELLVIVGTVTLSAALGVAYAAYSTEQRRRAGLPVPPRGIGSYLHAAFGGALIGVTIGTVALLLYRTIFVRFPQRSIQPVSQAAGIERLLKPQSAGTPLLPGLTPLV